MHTSALLRSVGIATAALIALLVTACGGDYHAAAAAPTIASFSATPTTVAAGSPVQLT